MDRLNELLQELGLTKVKLAKYLGVSRQMVYNYLVLDSLDKWPKEKKVLLLQLLDIKDNRCLDADCDREGQYLVKLLVLNEAKIAYVELGTLEPTSFKLEKISLEYTLNLIRVDENGATLTVTPNVEEE